MVDGMDGAVGAAVACVIDQLAPRGRLRVGDDIVVLQVHGGGPDWQVIRERHVLTEQPAHDRQEILAVPLLEFPAQLIRHWFLLEFAERRTKLACRINHHLGTGKQAQFVADGMEVRRQLGAP